MLEIVILERLSYIISCIAEGCMGDARVQIDRLNTHLQSSHDVAPEVQERALAGLLAAQRQIAAHGPVAGANELWRISEFLWDRLIPPDAEGRLEPLVPEWASSIPPGSALISITVPEDDEPLEPEGPQGAFRVIASGPAYRTQKQTAKILRTKADTVRELLGRGDLVGEQLEDNGPLFVTSSSIAAYQTKLFAATVAENRRKPRH